jgi:hypothetical protein
LQSQRALQAPWQTKAAVLYFKTKAIKQQADQ